MLPMFQRCSEHVPNERAPNMFRPNAVPGNLRLPLAISRTGMGLGFVFLVLSALQVVGACEILRIATDFTGATTYSGIALSLHGENLESICNLVQSLFAFGCGVSYLLITSNELLYVFSLLQHSFAWRLPYAWCASREFLLSVVTLAVVLPLSLLRSMKALQYTAFLAVSCCLYINGVIVLHSPGLENACRLAEHSAYNCVGDKCVVEPRSWVADYSDEKSCAQLCEDVPQYQAATPAWARYGPGLWQSIPILILAFNPVVAYVPVLTEMKRKRSKRVRVTTFAAVLLCFLVYVSASFGGYLSFCDRVCPNILDCYPAENVLVLFARVSLIMILVCTFPVYAFPVRLALLRALKVKKQNKQKMSDALSLLIVFSALTLANIFSNLDVVIGLTGATCGVSTLILLPGIFWVKLATRTAPEPDSPLWKRRGGNLPVSRVPWGGTCHKLIGYALIAEGVVFLLVCPTTIILQAIQS